MTPISQGQIGVLTSVRDPNYHETIHDSYVLLPAQLHQQKMFKTVPASVSPTVVLPSRTPKRKHPSWSTTSLKENFDSPERRPSAKSDASNAFVTCPSFDSTNVAFVTRPSFDSTNSTQQQVVPKACVATAPTTSPLQPHTKLSQLQVQPLPDESLAFMADAPGTYDSPCSSQAASNSPIRRCEPHKGDPAHSIAHLDLLATAASAFSALAT